MKCAALYVSQQVIVYYSSCVSKGYSYSFVLEKASVAMWVGRMVGVAAEGELCSVLPAGFPHPPSPLRQFSSPTLPLPFILSSIVTPSFAFCLQVHGIDAVVILFISFPLFDTSRRLLT